MDSENISGAFLLANFSRAASQGGTHQASDRNFLEMQLFIENRELESLHGEKFTLAKAGAHWKMTDTREAACLLTHV